ncbi:MAG: polysaccharide biosynthesis/export family protein [Desulfuromonadales bacterium]|nr:polysaccharide biosynthesis/export family protein [Desulfuromonadales bacterium]
MLLLVALSIAPVCAFGESTSVDSSWWARLITAVGLSNPDQGVIAQPNVAKMDTASPEYIIGPGDVIGISVWRDENLTRSVVVLPDGKISYPLLGELVAGNKTVARLKQELEAGLTRYVADANVTVEVKQSNSMIIYIIGRVNSPGRQLLVADTNVLQALAMAGGMNPFAKKGKVRIFRQEQGKTVTFPFDYDEVLEGRHLETNIVLKRGDVIVVP